MSPKKKSKTKDRRKSKATVRKSVKQGKKKVDKKELLVFKKLILNKKEEILDGIKHVSEDALKKTLKDAAGDISGYTYHMADVATDTYDREFSLGLASTERQMLYELDDALKRIDEGTFGLCEECNSAITKIRLKAIPNARLCLKCQEKKERR